MTWRTGHGKGAGVPRIEVMPIDELPVGLPAEARAVSRDDRGDLGRFAQGNTLAREGGKARVGHTRLGDKLSFVRLPDDAPFAPYQRSAVSWRRAKRSELADTVGGGQCGAGPSAIVTAAAIQFAWSRFLSDRAAATGDAKLAMQASKLSIEARQNLMAAHELCAKEAIARAAAGASLPSATPWLVRGAEPTNEPSITEDERNEEP